MNPNRFLHDLLGTTSVPLWQQSLCASVANPLGVLDFPRCTRWQKCLQSEQSRAPAPSPPSILTNASVLNPLGVLDFPRCTRWQKCLQSEQSRAPALALPSILTNASVLNPLGVLKKLGVLGGKIVFSPNKAERPPSRCPLSSPTPRCQNLCASVSLWQEPCAPARVCGKNPSVPSAPLWSIPSVYSIFLGVLGGKSVFSPNKAERPPLTALDPPQRPLYQKSSVPLCLCGKIPAPLRASVAKIPLCPLRLCGQSPRCTRFSSVYSVAKVSSVALLCSD